MAEIYTDPETLAIFQGLKKLKNFNVHLEFKCSFGLKILLEKQLSKFLN